MKTETASLRSRIARRIFTLFIVSALVPVTTLAILSFAEVTNHFNAQAQRHLHQTGKAVGMAILERLLGLQAELQTAASYLRTSDGSAVDGISPSLREHLTQRFTAIVLATGDDRYMPLLGDIPNPPRLTEAQRKHLGSGKSVLFPDPLSQRLFLITALEPGDSAGESVIAEINTGYLWDVRETVSLTMELCLLDAQGRVLYSSSPGFGVVSKRAQSKASHVAAGQATWAQEREDYLVQSWSIFLEAAFLAPPLTVVIGEPRSEALKALTDFKAMFPLVVLLAVLLVVLLSSSQIRRSLIPLERLREGTRRLANREFDSRVDVRSGDEFEELADSFNAMAFRLGRQFNVLGTMAEIDRLILSALDTKSIVRTILLRMRDIVLCDFVAVTLVKAGSSHSAQTFFGTGSENDLSSHDTQLTPDEVQALRDHPESLVTDPGERMPDYLQPLVQQGAQSHAVLPIFLGDELSALITMGFREDPRLSDEDWTQARRLTDRVAVALSNASWEEKLYHQAHYDALTDLPNRMLLKDRLPQALVRAKRNNTHVAVLFLDLDRFKSINDSLGHAAGDLFLREITRRLTLCVRNVDTIVRLGGDEFTIIIPDIEAGQDLTSEISSVADRVLAAVAEPFVLHGHEVNAAVSIGIALYPRDGNNYDELLKNADSAMYHAKAKGKGNYQFYSSNLNVAAVERLDMESNLRHALEEEQFEVHYHPQVDIASGRIVGAEALVRWRHPEKGLLPPLEFIPLAEQTGLIVPIGEWVLKTACAQNQAWRSVGFAPITVAVNLSARQFSDPQLSQKIEKILHGTGLEPSGLAVEITEGTVMENMEMTTQTLRQLNQMGLTVAIDDFGTGYSSLSYLKRFPIRTLKIDQSFVRNITSDHHEWTIVMTIIGLALNLNLEVVAEGVETEEQLAVLRELQCNAFQGYLISKPLPAAEFQALLEDGERTRSAYAAV